MKIKIQDKEIELKYSFRSMLIYEKITDRSFSPSGLYDIVINMKEMPIERREFIQNVRTKVFND